jgi:hypothetical protein
MRLLLSLLLVAGALVAQAPGLPVIKPVPPGPEQPIPFSHKTHAAEGLECAACHTMPDPGYFAEIAGTDVCMGCHLEVKTDSAAIQTLAEAHRAGKQIEWKPVYAIPDFVYFSHKEHVETAGAQCAACHGDVASQDVLAKERNISMPGCISCHRATNAPVECDFCHLARGVDLFP